MINSKKYIVMIYRFKDNEIVFLLLINPSAFDIHHIIKMI